jgi:hypothetical protein
MSDASVLDINACWIDELRRSFLSSCCRDSVLTSDGDMEIEECEEAHGYLYQLNAFKLVFTVSIREDCASILRQGLSFSYNQCLD